MAQIATHPGGRSRRASRPRETHAFPRRKQVKLRQDKSRHYFRRPLFRTAISETIARQAKDHPLRQEIPEKLAFHVVSCTFPFVGSQVQVQEASKTRRVLEGPDALCEWAESADSRADHVLPARLQSNKSAE